MMDKLSEFIYNLLMKKKNSNQNMDQNSFQNMNQNNNQNNNQNMYMNNQRKPYNDDGYTDYPVVYIKSKWFIPVMAILFILVLIALYIRIWGMPNGTLKNIEENIPDIIYTGTENEIGASVSGSGNLSHTDFYFSSDNDEIIEPKTKGGVTGKKVVTDVYTKRTGTVTMSVYATLGGLKTKQLSKEVAVCNPLTKDRLALEEVDIGNSNEYQIKLDLGESEKCYEGLTYSSDNIVKMTVSKTGLIQKKALGKATITITQNGNKIEMTANGTLYTTNVTGISLNVTELTLEKGSTEKLIARLTPNDATAKGVIWTSSNPYIATVSNRGEVTGYHLGAVTITATSEDGAFVASVPVNVVEKKTIPVRGIDINPKTLNMTKNSTAQLNATITPHDATNQEVIWSTSNNDIAIVSNKGLVTAYEEGTVTITVTSKDGTYKASTVVTITD